MTRRRLARRAPALMAFLALAGCVPPGGPSAGGPQAGLLEGGDFQAARAVLKERAARCESGERGREAVLIWAAVELDLRNPEGSRQTAARLAARYLQLPDADTAGIYAAESLYLLALDRGASPVEEPWAFPAVAPRFTRCDDRSPEPGLLRELPSHPGTPAWQALRSTRAHADSLRTELERIRTLLKQSGRPREDRL